jgi:putative transposase
MFSKAISTRCVPRYLGSDNDPLFLCHCWQANLRVHSVKEFKSVPHLPVSHPFAERLTGTIRREYLDPMLFRNASDPERKPDAFRQYYNARRIQTALDGAAPSEMSGEIANHRAVLDPFRWKSRCHGLYQPPVAA